VQANSDAAAPANSDPAAPRYLAGILLAVVVVAALASLAVIQEARQRGEVLDLVEVTRTFSPANGERARIEWRQRSSSDDAVVRIIDRAGDPVRTLLDGGPLAGDDTQQVFSWDGRDDSGRPAEPGAYRIEILLRDLDREIVPEQSRMRLVRVPSGQAES
jgi:flagellar hook assembly protein FlgD